MTEALDYFDIACSDARETDENGVIYALGHIAFGSQRPKETIALCLSNWRVDRYVEQWKDGLKRILTSDQTKSFLIASVQPRQYDNAIAGYPMYKEGAALIFREVI